MKFTYYGASFPSGVTRKERSPQLTRLPRKLASQRPKASRSFRGRRAKAHGGKLPLEAAALGEDGQGSPEGQGGRQQPPGPGGQACGQEDDEAVHQDVGDAVGQITRRAADPVGAGPAELVGQIV